MNDDTISRAAAAGVVNFECGEWRGLAKTIIDKLEALPSAESELENKIRAIGYTGKEGRIYIGGRLFAVRELPQ